MTYDNWRDAEAALSATISDATPLQRELARLAQIELPSGLPRLVASARLRVALSTELFLPRSTRSTEDQLLLIAELAKEIGTEPPLPEERSEASAWILHYRLRLRRDALIKVCVDAGDVVELCAHRQTGTREVSSIGEDGRIYFKGGGGASAWPDQIGQVWKRTDLGADATARRREAANDAALRAPAGTWSMAKQKELEQFLVETSVTQADIDALETALERAVDEKPLQKLFEERPQILTALVGGHFRYCIPQVRLGADYVCDFLLAETNSLGVHWLLVELESPRAMVTLMSSNELDQHARKGVSQIAEWRDWLMTHLADARRSRTEGGLGLFDIRPKSDGLVLVGNRAELRDNNAAVRAPIAKDANIRVHTYDWLRQQLEGRLNFSGPDLGNPYLLRQFDQNYFLSGSGLR